MAIALDQITTLGGGSATYHNKWWTAVGTGSDRVLVAFIPTFGYGITYVKYGGVAMTRAVLLNSYPGLGAVYYLANPAAGSNNFEIQWSGGSSYPNIILASYTGCDTSSPIGNTASAVCNNSTSVSVSLTSSSTNSLLLDFYHSDRSYGSPANSQVNVQDFYNYIYAGVNKLTNKSGATTMGYTWASASNGGIIAIELKMANPIPAAPTNVAATDGSYTDKVVVTWTKSSGATGYKVYEGANLLATLGDVATYDDPTAPAPTITPGTAAATDGSFNTKVALSLSGYSSANGATRSYTVKATNAAGDSAASSADTGYRSVGAITFQWQRSAADSDTSYSNITNATSVSYDDTGAPSNGAGRYYKCVLNAAGAVSATSTANRGYRSVYYSIVAAYGSFILTGIATVFKKSLKIAFAFGSYTVTGQNSLFKKALTMIFSTGSYTLTGFGAFLGKVKTIIAEFGSFVLTGQATTFRKFLTFISDFANYSVTGISSQFKKSFYSAVFTGSYVLTGFNTSLSKIWKSLSSAYGSFALTGFNSVFVKNKFLSAITGIFNLVGYPSRGLFNGSPTLWTKHSKPTTNWTRRTKPSETIYTNRTKPTTNWTKRIKP